MPHTSTKKRNTLIVGMAALAAVGVMMLSLVLANPTQAAAEDDAGAAAIAPGAATGYYLWHDADGSHLRTHGPGAEHFFVARLHTDGVFIDVSTVRAESRDSVTITDGGHTLLIRLHTYDGIDGVNYRVRGGTAVHVRLELDGGLIGTDQVFLGALLRHPAHNPFTITRP